MISTDTMHIMMDIVHPLNIYSSPHPLTTPTPLFQAEDSFGFFGHIVFFLFGIVEVTVVCPDVASFLLDTCLCREWIFAKNLCLYISALCRDYWKLHILVEHSFTALYSTHAACCFDRVLFNIHILQRVASKKQPHWKGDENLKQ